MNAHYTNFETNWRWPDYPPSTLACPHCGQLYMDEESLDALQLLHDEWHEPIEVLAAHRCSQCHDFNQQPDVSTHAALAFYCRCAANQQKEFVALARACGFTGTGRYHSKGYVHLDTGPTRNWAG